MPRALSQDTREIIIKLLQKGKSQRETLKHFRVFCAKNSFTLIMYTQTTQTNNPMSSSCYLIPSYCFADCGGKICENGGTLNPNTCECTCTRSYHTTDTCSCKFIFNCVCKQLHQSTDIVPTNAGIVNIITIKICIAFRSLVFPIFYIIHALF